MSLKRIAIATSLLQDIWYNFRAKLTGNVYETIILVTCLSMLTNTNLKT